MAKNKEVLVMKKMVIVAGWGNCGKTTSTNLVICKLINQGYTVVSSSTSNFWNKVNRNGKCTVGGSAVLEKDEKKIAVITFGDIVADVERVIKSINLDDVDCLVCCSRAAKGKKVFEYFYDFIGKIDIDKVKILPIYKNLISYHDRNDKENEQLSQIIVDWIA